MSVPQIPKPVKLIAGVLSSESTCMDRVIDDMEQLFGRIDFKTEPEPFVHTIYYCKEMGEGILRCFMSFQTLVRRDRLAEIKLSTNRLEEAYRHPGGGRRINIDPGLITMDNLVLATGKNYTHRIYLGSGIYADLTLIYCKGSFQPLPWTYPDYAEKSVISMFNGLRHRYREQLRINTNSDRNTK